MGIAVVFVYSEQKQFFRKVLLMCRSGFLCNKMQKKNPIYIILKQ